MLVSTLSRPLCPLRPLRPRLGACARRHVSDLSRARQIWGNRLVISEEVESALASSSPLIALESAIITHGMPHPTNLTTAQSLESIIRSSSSTPATIALLHGKIHVGLTPSQLEELADPDSEVARGAVKVSRRDLGPALALGKTGGTTVAGTMYIASSVGIKVFVTGGIGGVHRGAESSMDVSADLIELGRTPMAVICAGAKSILDLPRTLEVLETQGVCVATYGGRDFPAFYTPSSGYQSPWSVPDADIAASLIHTSLTLPIPLSTLLAVPIPAEHSQAGSAVQLAVEQAVRESVEQGIDKRGKEVTPWLLKRVGELTEGSALNLNVKLIENNARVGSQVAKRVSELFKQNGHASSSLYYPPVSSSSPAPETHTTPTPTPTPALPRPTVLVFGSAAIDLTSTSPHTLAPGTTTPGTVFVSPGGVGRNIAEAAQGLLPAGAVQLVSAFGSVDAGEGAEPDVLGKLLMLELDSAGMRSDGLVPRAGRSTAVCSLTLEKDGDLVAGVADMGIVETITCDEVEEKIRGEKPKMVVFDLNLLEDVLKSILKTCQELQIPTFCDPTSTPKLPRLLPSLLSLLPLSPSLPRPLTHLSPNLLELDLLHSLVSSSASDDTAALAWEFVDSLGLGGEWRAKVESFTGAQDGGGWGGWGREWIRQEGVVQKMVATLPYVGSFWVKASRRGLLHLRLTAHPPPAPTPTPGARDSISQKLSGPHEGKFLVLTHYAPPAIGAGEIVSTTGAGDTLVGGLVAGLAGGGEGGEGGRGGGRGEGVWVGKAVERVGRSLRSRRAVG